MIYILWPTIRPKVFEKMHTKWINRAKNPTNIKTLVAVNTEAQANEISTYNPIIVNPKNIGVCEPCHKLSTSINPNDDDIVILASDDFLAPENWDTYLIEKLNGKTGGLMVRDGYQSPDSSNMLHPAITIPILTGYCLKRMNHIIYNPVYNHMFSDCELYINLRDLNMLIDDRVSDNTMFEHLHYAAGKRQADEADRAYNAKWNEDDKMWQSRLKMPVEKRIMV